MLRRLATCPKVESAVTSGLNLGDVTKEHEQDRPKVVSHRQSVSSA